jgi:hypothetical protein
MDKVGWGRKEEANTPLANVNIVAVIENRLYFSSYGPVAMAKMEM